MENIRDYLKDHILIADGATGTYLSSLTGRSAVACETFNRSDPELVLRVHREYVRSGSKLLLTNTFCANTQSLGLGFDRVGDILRSGVELARRAADGHAFVAGDIGPLPEDRREEEEIEQEYRRIADVFLAEGVRIFQFETFADARYPVRVAEYIRSRLPEAFILISFAVTPDGYSRLGRTGESLIGAVRGSGCADAAGFNCCSGPAHMLAFASRIDYGELVPVISPNAGYPRQEDEVLVYSGMPEYFARKLSEAPALGFRILGGCCGTTPEHIRQLAALTAGAVPAPPAKKVPGTFSGSPARVENRFLRALESGKKALIVELDPPLGPDIARVEEAARIARQAGADALTVADSPMAKPRADSVMVAARLRRLEGIDVIPHICCRDKNINALKSSLIAAHIEGIRNILAVTGDPVPDTDRSIVRSVYNLNSAGLCGFIRGLNGDIFQEEPLTCGCAFNVNARNLEEEMHRLERKIEAGASFVLTQPVFSDESLAALRRARDRFHARGVRLLAGILTPLSYKNALFLANEIPGFALSDRLIRCFSPDMTREEGEAAGIGLSVSVAEIAAPNADGFYFITPFNRIGVTARLIGQLKSRGIV